MSGRTTSAPARSYTSGCRSWHTTTTSWPARLHSRASARAYPFEPAPPRRSPCRSTIRAPPSSTHRGVLGEDRGARDRLSQPACADERDVVLALRAQDLADFPQQGVDVVADAALAELAEGREVAPDLRRVDVRVVGDLLGRDPLLAHLLRLRQHLEVAREACRDADGAAVGCRCGWGPGFQGL